MTIKLYFLTVISLGLLFVNAESGDPPATGASRTIVTCQTIIQPIIKPTPTCSCTNSGGKKGDKGTKGDPGTGTGGTKVTYRQPRNQNNLSNQPSSKAQKTPNSAQPGPAAPPKRSREEVTKGFTSTSLTVLVVVVILAVLFCIAVIGALFFMVKRRTGMCCPNGRKYSAASPMSERRLVVN